MEPGSKIRKTTKKLDPGTRQGSNPCFDVEEHLLHQFLLSAVVIVRSGIRITIRVLAFVALWRQRLGDEGEIFFVLLDVDLHHAAL